MRCQMYVFCVVAFFPMVPLGIEFWRRMKIRNRQIFLQQVLSLMKSCLLFVLASRAEGMPLVIAEAMACGRAVVASNVDGVPEIVQDGMTGILVPAEDPASLASGLIKLYSDTAFRESLAKQGKEWAFREYNWEAIAGRYLSLIEECRAH